MTTKSDAVAKKLSGGCNKLPNGIAAHRRYSGFSPGLPVLILPGFMSSSLQIESSTLEHNWEGKRAWLDLPTLGLEAFKVTLPASRNRQAEFALGMPSPSTPTSTTSSDKDCFSSNEYQSSCECESEDVKSDSDSEEYAKRNRWIQHMILEEDHWRDPPGIRTRPVEDCWGLEGVQYLAEGAGASFTWVFAHVVRGLEIVGYKAGKDLFAAPYDWRLPPCRLEERDRYFTRLKNTIEQCVKGCGRPVVLLAHSMGCRVAHYFLNWLMRVQLVERDPKSWVQKHVHTFLAVGAPFLGAPMSVRSTISGDYMGLEAFLNSQEALLFGRRMGSPPFLYPDDAQLALRGLTAHFYLRRQGRLLVRVTGMDGSATGTVLDTHMFYVTAAFGKRRLRGRKMRPGLVSVRRGGSVGARGAAACRPTRRHLAEVQGALEQRAQRP
uniref:Lecithin:cholesterol acyltransferase n=1 Tax=Tetraselmis sp. GSL018 TaxID=582737 RepID=A0A061RJR3_9CHLO